MGWVISFATSWATVSSLGTALGTLVLAVATFAAVRSYQQTARISEMALQEQRRPVLTHSRITDPPQKMSFVDRHWVETEGGRGTAEVIDGIVYLTISLRNVGQGMAVCQAWAITPKYETLNERPHHAPLDDFRTQTRDIYVAAGDIGVWQGALRNPEDPDRRRVAQMVEQEEPLSIELLYSDMVGGQRTVTRFGLFPKGDDWYLSMSRHWHLDIDSPRPHEHIEAAHDELIDHLERGKEIAPGDVIT